MGPSITYGFAPPSVADTAAWGRCIAAIPNAGVAPIRIVVKAVLSWFTKPIKVLYGREGASQSPAKRWGLCLPSIIGALTSASAQHRPAACVLVLSTPGLSNDLAGRVLSRSVLWVLPQSRFGLSAAEMCSTARAAHGVLWGRCCRDESELTTVRFASWNLRDWGVRRQGRLLHVPLCGVLIGGRKRHDAGL